MTPDQAIRAAALASAIEHTNTWAHPANVGQLEGIANSMAEYIRTGKMGR